MTYLINFIIFNVLYFVEVVFVELSDKTCEIGMLVQLW